jgi:uncharacterized protein (TIGR02284 family)
VSTNHEVSKLDDLIITTIDSIKGYEHSAEKDPQSRYAGFFREMAAERREVVSVLQARSRALGGSPADYGSTAATIHRRFEDLRAALGGGDAAIIKEVERGEDYLKEEYDRVLNDDRMSEEGLAVVRSCYDSVRRGHDQASAYKRDVEEAAV